MAPVEPILIARSCGGYLALTPPSLGKLRFAVTAWTVEEARIAFARALAAWQRDLSLKERDE